MSGFELVLSTFKILDKAHTLLDLFVLTLFTALIYWKLCQPCFGANVHHSKTL